MGILKEFVEIKMKNRIMTVVGFCSFLVATQASAAVTLLNDDFSSGLSVTKIYDGVGTHNFGASVVNSGNPGDALAVNTQLWGGSEGINYFIGFNGLTYNPSTQGAIDSFSYSFDHKRPVYGYGGHGYALTMLQDDVYNYFGYSSFSDGSNWHTLSGSGLTEFDFSGARKVNNEVLAPMIDFSQSGSEIQLGLMIFSGNGGSPYRTDSTLYDNFEVNLITTPVPEPSTYALMLGGLGLVGFMARRRKQV